MDSTGTWETEKCYKCKHYYKEGSIEVKCYAKRCNYTPIIKNTSIKLDKDGQIAEPCKSCEQSYMSDVWNHVWDCGSYKCVLKE